jgi:spore maturation protein CgeB
MNLRKEIRKTIREAKPKTVVQPRPDDEDSEQLSNVSKEQLMKVANKILKAVFKKEEFYNLVQDVAYKFEGELKKINPDYPDFEEEIKDECIDFVFKATVQ